MSRPYYCWETPYALVWSVWAIDRSTIIRACEFCETLDGVA